MGPPRRTALLALALLCGCPPPAAAPPQTVSVAPAPARPTWPPAGVMVQPAPAALDEGPVYAMPDWTPISPPLADGSGLEVLTKRCTPCHSTTYVTMQPPLDGKGWEAVVTKMIKLHGAAIGEDDAQTVVAYLRQRYGPDTIAATWSAVLPSAPVDDSPGARVYRAACYACHQESGLGLGGAFPPLVRHAPAVAAADRRHLVRLVLFGMEGKIAVQGQTFENAMPPWGHLSDVEVAAVLDHVTRAWGNEALLPPGFAPFTPAEVAAARAAPLTAREVHAERPAMR